VLITHKAELGGTFLPAARTRNILQRVSGSTVVGVNHDQYNERRGTCQNEKTLRKQHDDGRQLQQPTPRKRKEERTLRRKEAREGWLRVCHQRDLRRAASLG
jgi:hypothetical protein